MPLTNTTTRWLTLWLSLLCATEIHAQNPLQRCGQGQFRFLGWSIYQAELFSANCPVQANQTFTLSIHYFIPISQAHLISTTDQELNRMHGHWPQQTLKKWNLEMEQAFRSVHSGDTFTGYYQPGLGARFYLNNIPTAEIPDTEFANWFFQIWLGPNAHDRHLRETLNPGGNWNPAQT